jgi:hypothetical protein
VFVQRGRDDGLLRISPNAVPVVDGRGELARALANKEVLLSG